MYEQRRALLHRLYWYSQYFARSIWSSDGFFAPLLLHLYSTSTPPLTPPLLRLYSASTPRSAALLGTHEKRRRGKRKRGREEGEIERARQPQKRDLREFQISSCTRSCLYYCYYYYYYCHCGICCFPFSRSFSSAFFCVVFTENHKPEK